MAADVNFAHLPHFDTKRHKVLAAIMFLLREAARTGRSLTRGEIAKSIFKADKDHLAECGRPVTFDNYVAMRRGPVGDAAIGILRGTVDWAEFGLAEAPWTSFTFRGKPTYRHPAPGVGDDILSPSDEEFLAAALNAVIRDGFDKTSERSHDHPAWSAAWAARGEAAAAPMDWRLFPEADVGRVYDLASVSRSGAAAS